MSTNERRWAGPAAAVLAFCLTLIFVAPPTSPALPLATPTAFLADAAAVATAHAMAGFVAAAGLVLAAKWALHRSPLKTQRLSTPSRNINAA